MQSKELLQETKKNLVNKIGQLEEELKRVNKNLEVAEKAK